MNVGVLGSGMVGQTLGAGFANHGHHVVMGSREPQREDIQHWVSRTGNGVTASTFEEAASFGELIVLCTNWHGTENALQMAGLNNLDGKVLIDVTNPLNFHNGRASLAIGFSDSAGESVQRWAPNAKVVKALNTAGSRFMVNPRFVGGPPDMLYCGNDLDAKEIVRKILLDFGWNPIDMGGIEESRLIEPLAMLWMDYFFRFGVGNHAFKLIRAE